ncbi:sulfite exporter TauE/SafE family protein [Aquabacterium sp.]|uniref:sulfite exporter TauE/SafE family protein n=1 Tax=Aquabacterium sp. TaxID=1872578 RepID=UPI002C013052|nr:sulfite exporter TauE/SafE family protein [Aquabacterium sp.]HSW08489.1 sulfite exporter TauE/SafE family protein [Aquabacterium sp.]
MSVDLLLLLLVGAAVAGFVQGLSGFAFGMVAMSFWVWGIEPQIAGVLTVFGGLTGQIVAAVSTRRSLMHAVFVPYLLGGLLGIPLGVLALRVIDPPMFKALFGLLLVTWCPAMLFSGRIPRIHHGGRLADGAVGVVGGVMGGIGGFTGVAPALWCTLRGYDKDLQRTIVQNFNLAALAVTMAVQAGTGAVTREMLPLFAMVAPAMALPSLLGARVHLGLSDQTSRRIVLALLTASGVAMIAASLPRLLAR